MGTVTVYGLLLALRPWTTASPVLVQAGGERVQPGQVCGVRGQDGWRPAPPTQNVRTPERVPEGAPAGGPICADLRQGR